MHAGLAGVLDAVRVEVLELGSRLGGGLVVAEVVVRVLLARRERYRPTARGSSGNPGADAVGRVRLDPPGCRVLADQVAPGSDPRERVVAARVGGSRGDYRGAGGVQQLDRQSRNAGLATILDPVGIEVVELRAGLRGRPVVPEVVPGIHLPRRQLDRVAVRPQAVGNRGHIADPRHASTGRTGLLPTALSDLTDYVLGARDQAGEGVVAVGIRGGREDRTGGELARVVQVTVAIGIGVHADGPPRQTGLVAVLHAVGVLVLVLGAGLRGERVVTEVVPLEDLCVSDVEGVALPVRSAVGQLFASWQGRAGVRVGVDPVRLQALADDVVALVSRGIGIVEWDGEQAVVAVRIRHVRPLDRFSGVKDVVIVQIPVQVDRPARKPGLAGIFGAVGIEIVELHAVLESRGEDVGSLDLVVLVPERDELGQVDRRLHFGGIEEPVSVEVEVVRTAADPRGADAGAPTLGRAVLPDGEVTAHGNDDLRGRRRPVERVLDRVVVRIVRALRLDVAQRKGRIGERRVAEDLDVAVAVL